MKSTQKNLLAACLLTTLTFGGAIADEHESGEMTALETAVAAADIEVGAAQFRACASCHTAEEGGANRMGPNLWGIVGRQVGSVDGVRYSQTLSEAEDSWTLESLDAFLTSPRQARPGTTMSYAGQRNEARRHAILAYLKSLTSE